MKYPFLIRRINKRKTVGWWNGQKWTTKREEALRYCTTDSCPDTLPLFPGVVLTRAINFYMYGNRRWAVIEKDEDGYEGKEWELT